jgi:hypothetical protein
MPELLASLDDINANLDEVVIEANDPNTDMIQISVARVIRGYLSRVIPTSTMLGWSSPNKTPEIIREIAAKLIAAQHYYTEISKQSTDIQDTHYAQILYDRAMEMLKQILEGDVAIIDPITGDDLLAGATSSMGELDFWPVDETDRAFTMGMEL